MQILLSYFPKKFSEITKKSIIRLSSAEFAVKKQNKNIPPLPLPATRIAGLAQL